MERDVQLPLGGLSDDKPHAKQPLGTAREVRNVRAQDSRDKREKIAQRSGLADHGSNAAVDTQDVPVRHLAHVVFAQQTVDYAEIADSELDNGDVVWSHTSNASAAREVVTDRQDNTYWPGFLFADPHLPRWDRRASPKMSQWEM